MCTEPELRNDTTWVPQSSTVELFLTLFVFVCAFYFVTAVFASGTTKPPDLAATKLFDAKLNSRTYQEKVSLNRLEFLQKSLGLWIDIPRWRLHQ